MSSTYRVELIDKTAVTAGNLSLITDNKLLAMKPGEYRIKVRLHSSPYYSEDDRVALLMIRVTDSS